MSGSLARLVLRAQGRLPVAEPLLPSRYAAAGPPTGLVEEIGEEPTAPPSSRRQEPATTAAPPTPLADSRAEPRLAPIAARQKATAQASSSPPIVAAPAPVSIASSVSISAERSGDEPPGRPARPVPAAPEPARTAQAGPPQRRSAPPPSPPARAEPAPPNPDRRPSPGVSPFLARAATLAATRAAAVEVPRPEAPAPAPDVHISIGRLEVHAAPARPAPARAAPAGHPALSLADYLAQRK